MRGFSERVFIESEKNFSMAREKMRAGKSERKVIDVQCEFTGERAKFSNINNLRG
jgi:hypothetical protein